ncbi:MAG TPA: DUF2249 domain-containing protein [Beutenbergiaceae bacterium]|nr:DUF2249 domain-containing protein [Beutenbergiaceae bacterium]
MTNRHVHLIQASGGSCGCGVGHAQEPEFDVREIPHRLRHGAVFGALAAVGAGESMVLVAPHDPKPLLAQIAEREAGAMSVTYLERGPQAWRLRLQREGDLA